MLTSAGLNRGRMPCTALSVSSQRRDRALSPPSLPAVFFWVIGKCNTSKYVTGNAGNARVLLFKMLINLHSHFFPLFFLGTNTFLPATPISCPLQLPTPGLAAGLLKAFKIVSLPKIAGRLQPGLVQCLCLHVQIAWGKSTSKEDYVQTTGHCSEYLSKEVLMSQLCARWWTWGLSHTKECTV